MKYKYDTLANQIISDLESTLPDQYIQILTNFRTLVSENKYRASYAELNKLLHLSDWSPSKKVKDLITRYQVVF